MNGSNVILGWARERMLLNRLADDQRTVAERKWQSGSKAPAPQQTCDVGLFSDDHKQQEMF